MRENRLPLDKKLKIRVTFNEELCHEQIFHDYPIIIGRQKNCHIPLTEFDFISRQHAVITIEDGILKLIDLNSANAFLYEGKLERNIELKDVSEINIGPINIHIEQITEKKQEEDTYIPELEKTSTRIISPSKEQDENFYLDEIEEKTEIDRPQQEEISTFSTSQVTSEKEVVVDNQIKMEAPRLHSESLLKKHPYAKDLKTGSRVLEASVKWLDQVYDHQHFYPQTKVTLGVSPHASLKLPSLGGDLGIAFYDGEESTCLIPSGAKAELKRADKIIDIDELIQSGLVAKKSKGYTLQLKNEDVLTVHYNPTTSVVLRYAPAPKRLSKTPMLNPDEEIRKSLTLSGIIHIFILVLALLSPAPSNIPKIKNVPKRYARLLVQPPKKIIEKKKPKPKPTPKKVVKKKEPPKPKPKKKKRIVQKKPKRKLKIVKNKEVKKVNKFPVKVEKPKPKIKELGALAALGNIKPLPNQNQVAININKNAGGAQKSLNTKGIVSNLKTKSGKLASSGSPGVKTRGLGVGTGEGYGTQGLQGRAGKRGVGGAVVGSPNLAKSGKTEGLTRKQINDTLKKYLSQIQRCYERSLFDNPDLKGRVEYQWEISPAGSVQWTKVVKSDMSGADSLNSCVKKVFLSMQFPRAKNGQSTVPKIGFPFGRL